MKKTCCTSSSGSKQAASDPGRHPQEAAWLKFILTRPAEEIRKDAKWLEREYPASFAVLRPKLLEAYLAAK